MTNFRSTLCKTCSIHLLTLVHGEVLLRLLTLTRSAFVLFLVLTLLFNSDLPSAVYLLITWSIACNVTLILSCPFDLSMLLFLNKIHELSSRISVCAWQSVFPFLSHHRVKALHHIQHINSLRDLIHLHASVIHTDPRTHTHWPISLHTPKLIVTFCNLCRTAYLILLCVWVFVCVGKGSAGMKDIVFTFCVCDLKKRKEGIHTYSFLKSTHRTVSDFDFKTHKAKRFHKYEGTQYNSLSNKSADNIIPIKLWHCVKFK